MGQVVIPRALVRWTLTVFVIIALGLTALALWQVSDERGDRTAAVAAATRANCEDGNDIREAMRGILTRSAAFRAREGTLTPAAAAFFEREVAALSDIDCRALPGGG